MRFLNERPFAHKNIFKFFCIKLLTKYIIYDIIYVKLREKRGDIEMELKDILELVQDNKVYIGLSYVGQNDYTITTKQEIIKENILLNNKVSSINSFKNKDRRIIGIKIFRF